MHFDLSRSRVYLFPGTTNQTEYTMKTGNGQNPNPKKLFSGQGKKETSNLVKPKTGTAFSAKKDIKRKK